MTMPEKIAILPLGATEQHGPHLPVETDSLIAAGVVAGLKNELPDDGGVEFLPVEETGYSPEHLDYPGSQSLNHDHAINRWIGIGEMLNSTGVRKLIMLNAHGGNSPLLTIVATELRVRFSMLAVVTSWTRFGVPTGLMGDDELAYGIHGGDIETSVMLALHPQMVELNKLGDFPSYQERLVKENTYLRAYGKHAFGWKMQDLNRHGVVGNANSASAEKGEKLLAHSVAGLLKLIEEVARFDMSHIDAADKMTLNG